MKRRYLRKIFLVLFVFLLVMTFNACKKPVIPQVSGMICGYVVDSATEAKKEMSGYLPVSEAQVTLIDAYGIIHTVYSDNYGYYRFDCLYVLPNTVITMVEKTATGKKVYKDVIPRGVSAEEIYNAGIADCLSTAQALVIESLLAMGCPQQEINLAEINNSKGFDKLVTDIRKDQTTEVDPGSDFSVCFQADIIAGGILCPPSVLPPDPDPSSEKDIISYQLGAADNVSLGENVSGIIDGETFTITLKVPYGCDLTALVSCFSLSENATARVGVTPQKSGVTTNDFTDPVTYTVWAEDNSILDWTVITEEELGPLDHFSISGAPSCLVAGESFGNHNITITAYDGKDRIKTDYTGTVVFGSLDISAVFPTDYTFSIGTGLDNGSHFFSGMAFCFKTAGSQIISVTDETISATTNPITVIAGNLDYITINPDNATIMAGQNQVYTAHAYDAHGNFLEEVTEQTEFVITSEAAGSWEDNSYTAQKSGDNWIVTGTYKDKSDTTSLTVNAGSLERFYFETIANQKAGIPFCITITAVDKYWNIVSDYEGINTLFDSTATINPNITTNFTNGTYSGNVTIDWPQNNIQITTSGKGKSGYSKLFNVLNP